MLAFARRQPLLAYYGLVFLISWGAILLIVGPRGRATTRPIAA
jgi:hypothetical protein